MNKGKLLAVSLIWLLVFGLCAVTWRLIVVPRWQQHAQSEAHQAEEAKRQQTSAPSAYDLKLRLGLDSFSGYAVLRSAEFRQRLVDAKMDLELIDDQADYAARLKGLQSGELQMAAFPIDALIIHSQRLGQLPAAIIAILDETRGADAMVAYRAAIPSPDALNDPEVRFVLTPDSPSEMLLRLMQSQFRWTHVTEQSIVAARDAADVLQRFRLSKPNSKEVFVTWEPYVSQILQHEPMVRVVDSSRFKGYIVDCLVANRDFLIKNPDMVEQILAAYFRALYQHRQDMRGLVIRDAAELGTEISPDQAQSLVEGIWWKNTLENFEHFGLAGNRLLLLEDMLENVTHVLTNTRAISLDPTGGKPNELYYHKPLESLRGSNFHPQLSNETVRNDELDLPELTEAQWSTLVSVGELQVEELVFARGQAVLTERSRVILDDLASRLKTYPQYYLLVRGNASQAGQDQQRNRDLALQRAKAAESHLIQSGIPTKRVKAVAGSPSGSMSVSFMLGQPAY